MPQASDGYAPYAVGPAGDAGLLLFNGSSFDRQYNNIQGVLVPSGARTAAPAIPTQTNPNFRGVLLWLNVTVASGTGGLTTTIRGIEPVTGTAFVALLTATAVTATGLFTYVLYPGAVTGPFTLGTNGILPRVWTANVAAGDSSSYTYSLAYSMLL